MHERNKAVQCSSKLVELLAYFVRMEHDVRLQHIEVSCASGHNASVQKRLFSQLIQFRKVYYVHRQCRIIAGHLCGLSQYHVHIGCTTVEMTA